MTVRSLLRRSRRVLHRVVNNRRAQQAVKEVVPARTPLGPRDLILVTGVINGKLFLPSFLKHYRALGVRRFIMAVDGRGKDETLDLLMMEPDVTVLSIDAPVGQFPDPHSVINFLFNRYATGRWCIFADIDEFFDYPLSSRCPMPELIEYLDARGYNALHALMLDRFNGQPLQTYETQPEIDLTLQYPLYDTTGLQWTPYASKFYTNREKPHPLMRIAHGGIMYSCFQANPLLMKHPLIKYQPSMSMRTHYWTGMQVADITGVLNHYRFVSDLRRRMEHFLASGFSWNLMRYGELYQRMTGEQETILTQPSSQTWTSVDALVDQGILLESEAYREWVRHARRVKGVL